MGAYFLCVPNIWIKGTVMVSGVTMNITAFSQLSNERQSFMIFIDGLKEMT